VLDDAGLKEQCMVCICVRWASRPAEEVVRVGGRGEDSRVEAKKLGARAKQHEVEFGRRQGQSIPCRMQDIGGR